MRALVLALFAHVVTVASAFRVDGPIPLSDLMATSDVIAKATAGTTRPVRPGDWNEIPGFRVYQTEFKVISALKGEPPRRFYFRHYGWNPRDPARPMWSPQYYQFRRDETYLLFARKTASDTILEPFSSDWREKLDEGVFWTLDDRPTRAADIQELIWQEMELQLDRGDAERIEYAIGQLDAHSGCRRHSPRDHDRRRTLARIHTFASHPDAAVAWAAIQAIGADSPLVNYRYYLPRDFRPPDWENFQAKLFSPRSYHDLSHQWLALVSIRPTSGIAKWEGPLTNELARPYIRELVAAVEQGTNTWVRAMAVRALGRVCDPEVGQRLGAWTKDADPDVRQVAVLLVADYPERVTNLVTAADDEQPGVRAAAMNAIGLGQYTAQLALLEKGLSDPASEVRALAARSLLSLDPDIADPVLERLCQSSPCEPEYINALAERAPARYADQLADIVASSPESTLHIAGMIPYARSWQLLWEYLQALPPDAFRDGRWDRHLEALAKAKFHGSSEPRDLYAWFLIMGWEERAARFRAMCGLHKPGDLEVFFQRVRELP